MSVGTTRVVWFLSVRVLRFHVAKICADDQVEPIVTIG
jgi:hypothetical protein